jgi:hypothetical protein
MRMQMVSEHRKDLAAMGLRIPDLEKLAAADDRTLSSLVTKILREWVMANKKPQSRR